MTLTEQILELDDKACLDLFLELIKKRVSLRVGYTGEEGVLTHQYLAISCGEYEGMSAPERLPIPLLPQKLKLEPETVQ